MQSRASTEDAEKESQEENADFRHVESHSWDRPMHIHLFVDTLGSLVEDEGKRPASYGPEVADLLHNNHSARLSVTHLGGQHDLPEVVDEIKISKHSWDAAVVILRSACAMNDRDDPSLT